jgi:hypothetical protein
MARYQLTAWHISRFPANATRGAYAAVTLRGREYQFFRTLIVSERLNVPLDTIDERVHSNKEIIKRAKAMSNNKWIGNV